jgi:esterase/lipase
MIYDYVLKNMKNITEKNIYVLGRSLGTGPAVYLSSKRNPAATILISPFTTYAAVGKPDEEDKEFLLTQFRSIDYVDKINNPLLIIHGKIDPTINYNEAIQLYEKAGKNIIKEIKLVDNMPHIFFLSELKKNVIPLIIEFVDKHCPLNNKSNNVDIDFDKGIFITDEEYKKTIFNYCGKEEI